MEWLQLLRVALILQPATFAHLHFGQLKVNTGSLMSCTLVKAARPILSVSADVVPWLIPLLSANELNAPIGAYGQVSRHMTNIGGIFLIIFQK